MHFDVGKKYHAAGPPGPTRPDCRRTRRVASAVIDECGPADLRRRQALPPRTLPPGPSGAGRAAKRAAGPRPQALWRGGLPSRDLRNRDLESWLGQVARPAIRVSFGVRRAVARRRWLLPARNLAQWARSHLSVSAFCTDSSMGSSVSSQGCSASDYCCI